MTLALDWILVGHARLPHEPRSVTPHRLLLHTSGKYVVVIAGEHVRIPKDWGRAHDSTRNAAAVKLGKRSTKKKAIAARTNGAKGGRPKGTTRTTA